MHTPTYTDPPDMEKEDDEVELAATEDMLDGEEADIEGVEVKAAEPDAEGNTNANTELSADNIQQGDLDATRIYLSEIGFSPLLTAA